MVPKLFLKRTIDLSHQNRENIPVIENQPLFAVCYQCTQDLWTSVIFLQ